MGQYWRLVEVDSFFCVNVSTTQTASCQSKALPEFLMGNLNTPGPADTNATPLNSSATICVICGLKFGCGFAALSSLRFNPQPFAGGAWFRICVIRPLSAVVLLRRTGASPNRSPLPPLPPAQIRFGKIGVIRPPSAVRPLMCLSIHPSSSSAAALAPGSG